MTTWVCFGLGSLALLTRRSCPLMPRWTTRESPLSRVRTRYLPTRPTALTDRPSRRVRKCLALACRRTDRPLATATALIFLPVTSLARSWRRVSTSGSSGIDDPLPGGAGGVLLGVLLRRPLPRPLEDPADEDLGDVVAVVVGPGPGDDVPGDARTLADGQLLEAALVVEVVGLGGGPGQAVADQPEDQRAGGVPAGVEVDGADDGFEGVGQDGRLGPAAGRLLAPAEEEDGPDAEAFGDLGEDPGVDDGGPDLGELPLGEVGVEAVAVLGHHQPQHGVSEEFEPFVRRRPVLFAAPAAVRQGLLEQPGITKVIRQPFRQPCVPHRSRCPGPTGQPAPSLATT